MNYSTNYLIKKMNHQFPAVNLTRLSIVTHPSSLVLDVNIEFDRYEIHSFHAPDYILAEKGITSICEEVSASKLAVSFPKDTIVDKPYTQEVIKRQSTGLADIPVTYELDNILRKYAQTILRRSVKGASEGEQSLLSIAREEILTWIREKLEKEGVKL